MTPTELLRQNEQLARALRAAMNPDDEHEPMSDAVYKQCAAALAAYAASKSSESGVTEEPTALDYWNAENGDLHPATSALVWNFALALCNKLADAEKKYGYTDGWRSKDWEAECRTKLREHVEKGDPRDVAAYCAFMWSHGWSTANPNQPPAGDCVTVPRAPTEEIIDSVRYMITGISMSTPRTVGRFREHCTHSGVDMSHWPKWATDGSEDDQHLTKAGIAILFYHQFLHAALAASPAAQDGKAHEPSAENWRQALADVRKVTYPDDELFDQIEQRARELAK